MGKKRQRSKPAKGSSDQVDTDGRATYRKDRSKVIILQEEESVQRRRKSRGGERTLKERKMQIMRKPTQEEETSKHVMTEQGTGPPAAELEDAKSMDVIEDHPIQHNRTDLVKQIGGDDYLFLLKKCPTMEMINDFTTDWNRKQTALSVGHTILSLLCTDHKTYGFQLLENIHQCGETALEQVILNDVVCTPEGWGEIAEECSENNYSQLSEKIMSIVISQDGVLEISSKDEDAKIMEHVYM